TGALGSSTSTTRTATPSGLHRRAGPVRRDDPARVNNTEQDPQVRTALVDRLIPFLARRPDQDFNVFRVMHHGTHEKQLSNLFAWLLDQRGSHKLGSRFLRVF